MTTLAPASGTLAHVMTIQALTVIDNDDGTVTRTWDTADADDPIRRANIEPLRGREYLEAQQMKAGVTHRVTIRPWNGLTPRHRLLFGTRIFNIVSVLNMGECDLVMQIMCQEEV